jgi:hypothetical protein
MFVPAFDLIKDRIREASEGTDESELISVPRDLLEFLLRCLLETVDFDEDQYQRCNPDVMEVVQCRTFANGREHFIQTGYFEDRTGGDSGA